MNIINQNVASFMGAWIETCKCSRLWAVGDVASFMGAWIETFGVIRSAPPASVASFMGAWIETRNGMMKMYQMAMSHPLWVRGLKR